MAKKILRHRAMAIEVRFSFPLKSICTERRRKIKYRKEKAPERGYLTW